MNDKLCTIEYNKIDKSCPLSEYPRPQFKRDSYFSLNGYWDFKITRDYNKLIDFKDKILVPFCVESLNSEVQKRITKDDYLVYHRHFKLDKSFIKKNTFINLLGVDQRYFIILNNKKFDWIEPLALPTKIDISSEIQEENEIYIIVQDQIDNSYPLGKQVEKPHGMFYTPVSGIYYPIFIESMDDNYIEEIKITPSLDTVNIIVKTNSPSFEISIYQKDKEIVNKTIDGHEFSYKFDSPVLWTPDNPFLYNIIIKTTSDRIESYFGLRTISMKDGFVYLNNEKEFLNGVLDQGYFPEGLYTPSTYKNYEFDILTMKDLGFNMLRKHIKIELPYFYYLCDKLGMLVLQDFVNNGKYRYFHDTVFPTIGFQKFKDHRLKNDKIEANFRKHYPLVIKYLYNHPSIIGYTIFNEGWGQFDSTQIYYNAKSLDTTRVFDSNSGWFRVCPNDFNSYHTYFGHINDIPKLKNTPLFISEFGGYVYKDFSHSFNQGKQFGYKFYTTLDEYESELIKLYELKIIPYKERISGLVYTQLSDVEDENNGLLTYDRKVLKVNKDNLKATMSKLKR